MWWFGKKKGETVEDKIARLNKEAKWEPVGGMDMQLMYAEMLLHYYNGPFSTNHDGVCSYGKFRCAVTQVECERPDCRRCVIAFQQKGIKGMDLGDD